MSASPHITVDDMQRFSEYLYQRTGMVYGESKRYYIERRVGERMRMTRDRQFASYFVRLKADPAELEALINAFTVNETYFYREEHQLRSLSSEILPAIAAGKEPGDKIRIWSAPCATGEEPYSIAIWLLENWPMVDAYNVEIVGSDIDTDVLEAAHAGLYGERALSRLPRDLADRYFEPAIGGMREIIDDLKESVTFTRANLIEDSTLSSAGQFEVIFCRNMLIYFDDASRVRAMDNLYAALRPGGYICLGHTESMSRISARFEVRRLRDAIVWRRPESHA